MADRRRVLVTRPEPGASRTAAALAEAGLEPVIMPFTQTVALPVAHSLVDAAGASDAVVVTSAKALTHAPPDLIDALAGKPVFAVGEATAAATPAGSGTIVSADGDADALAELVAGQLPAAHTVAYLCGRVRTGALERRLSDLGRSCVLIETYDVEQVSHLADKLETVLRDAPPEAVMFHSGVSAALFLKLAAQRDLDEIIENIEFLVISERVAQRLEGLRARGVTAASEPRDDALIACVRQRLAD